MKLLTQLFLAGALVVMMGSCTKTEGPGGAATITGKVHALVRDGFGTVIDEYDIAKEDVYIIYGGENTMYDDDHETSYDGTFRFDYLETGTYQVFVYEKCLISEGCPDNKRPVIMTVEIKDKKEVVDLGTINIYK